MRFLFLLWFVAVAGQFVPALLSAWRIALTRELNSYNRYLLCLLLGHGFGAGLRLYSSFIAAPRVEPPVFAAVAASLEALGTSLFFLHLMGYINGFRSSRLTRRHSDLPPSK